MSLELAEKVTRWMGGLVAYATLGIVMFGIWRGTHRPAGRTAGRNPGWLRSPLFYLVSVVLFMGISAALWHPLPLTILPPMRAWVLALGILIYFPGMLFILWGRLALGKMYFVSTGFGAQLYADHQLVTHGPFALVRHPMYVGLITTAFGSLLLYQTWTTAFFAFFTPFVLLRARREEQALAAEFGEQWQLYCRRVPAVLPWLRKVGKHGKDECS